MLQKYLQFVSSIIYIAREKRLKKQKKITIKLCNTYSTIYGILLVLASILLLVINNNNNDNDNNNNDNNNTVNNNNKMLHPKADVERLYIPRKDGGRGLIEVETAFRIATIGLNHYLKNKDGQYPKQVLEHDTSKAKNSMTKNASKFKGEVPISEYEKKEHKSASENAKALKYKIKNIQVKSVKKEKLKKKCRHGQYPKLLEKPHVDIVTTNKWLSSNLKGETDGLLVEAQDQALNTRNYQKVICGQKVESKCRMCSQHKETVDHIVSGCEVLAKTEYISRLGKAAPYLHWNICQDNDIEVTDKLYEHKPESVTHSKDSKITIMWDMPVNTDRTITGNRPDIIIKDSVNSTCKLIDMSIPSDRNIALKEIQKKKQVQRPRVRNTENVADEN